MRGRGYVWEPDRNEKDDKEFITFIAQVEGLSAVPDGRIYMNAYIDTIKGEIRRGAHSAMNIIETSFVCSTMDRNADASTLLGLMTCFVDDLLSITTYHGTYVAHFSMAKSTPVLDLQLLTFVTKRAVEACSMPGLVTRGNGVYLIQGLVEGRAKHVVRFAPKKRVHLRHDAAVSLTIHFLFAWPSGPQTGNAPFSP